LRADEVGIDGLIASSAWHHLLSRAAPPLAGIPGARRLSEVPDASACPGGEHYREIAGKLREVARRCRFPGARRELLHLASNYERRGDYIGCSERLGQPSQPVATPASNTAPTKAR
jgi:hypothetical protein